MYLNVRPQFDRDCDSYSVESSQIRPGNRKKLKEIKKNDKKNKNKGTINKGGARNANSGACCGQGGNDCKVF